MNTSPATIPVLYPLVDPTGQSLQGPGGVALASDDQGIVYTLRGYDQPPEVMGELTPTDRGQIILVPLNGLGATGTSSSEKNTRVDTAKCRLSMAKRRRTHLERRIRSLTKKLESGQAAGSLSPRDQTKWEKERQDMTSKLESAKSAETTAHTAFDEANNTPASGTEGIGHLGESWWNSNRDKILGFGAGAATAALAASAASKGSGLNTLVTQGWDATKQFFLPPSAGGPSALPGQANAPTPVVMPPSVMMPVPMSQMPAPMRQPMPMMPQGGGTPPRFVPAGIGGMDSKTLLILGALGVGALVMIKMKR